MPQRDKALFLNRYHNITPGTAAAGKALILGDSGELATITTATVTTGTITTLNVDDLVFTTGGTIIVDEGTANASALAATVNKMAGVVTTNSVTTANGDSFNLTITNSVVATNDIVLCSVENGTNSAGSPVIGLVTVNAGSFVVQVHNIHASADFNGTLKISFVVFKT